MASGCSSFTFLTFSAVSLSCIGQYPSQKNMFSLFKLCFAYIARFLASNAKLGAARGPGSGVCPSRKAGAGWLVSCGGDNGAAAPLEGRSRGRRLGAGRRSSLPGENVDTWCCLFTCIYFKVLGCFRQKWRHCRQSPFSRANFSTPRACPRPGGVRRETMRPVLSWKVVERKQHVLLGSARSG